MGKNQKSTNEDFFLTDENDGYNSYGLKSAVRENHIKKQETTHSIGSSDFGNLTSFLG